MILTPRLQKAIDTAALLHKDHVRIGKEKIPYITHLIHVLVILDNHGADEDTLIAGLLHDTIEDIPEYTGDILENEFGPDVRNIVESLTETRVFDDNLSPRERWIAAKKSYLEKLSGATPDAHVISAADKIHNMSCIIQGYEIKDEIMTLRFDVIALAGQVWFAGEVLKVLSGNIPKDLEENYISALKKLTIIKQQCDTQAK
jgi:(p)ppGpp synthase/HD superfamily hydrolase